MTRLSSATAAFLEYSNCVRSLRIAFLILAHSDAPHLERLCRALRPHSVFVHVDAKAGDTLFAGIQSLSNVSVLQPSINVYWGDFSMVEATLALMEGAQASGPFDRYVLLSGACYPIKPVATLEAEFAAHPDREWINLTEIRRGSHLDQLIGRRWRMAPLLENRASDVKLRGIWNKLSKLAGRDIRREIQMKPFFGSQWWALTHSCIGMIAEFARSHPAFVKAYRTVYAPDEHFFATIVGNSCFAAFSTQIDDLGAATNQVIPLHLTSTTEDRCWRNGPEEQAELIGTTKYFARKVSTTRSGMLLDWIDTNLI